MRKYGSTPCLFAGTLSMYIQNVARVLPGTYSSLCMLLVLSRTHSLTVVRMLYRGLSAQYGNMYALVAVRRSHFQMQRSRGLKGLFRATST